MILKTFIGCLIIFIIIGGLTMIINNGNDDTPLYNNTSTNTKVSHDGRTESPVSDTAGTSPTNNIINKKRYTIDEFMSMLALQWSGDVKEDAEFTDITPEDVFDGTGCQIFQDDVNLETYIICDGLVNRLFLPQITVGNIMLCNFGDEENLEILYTISYTIGLHGEYIISKIGYVKPSMRLGNDFVSAEIYRGEIYLEKISNNHFKIFGKAGENTDTDIQEEYIFIGEVIEKDGAPFFVL